MMTVALISSCVSACDICLDIYVFMCENCFNAEVCQNSIHFSNDQH